MMKENEEKERFKDYMTVNAGDTCNQGEEERKKERTTEKKCHIPKIDSKFKLILKPKCT